MDNKDLDTLIEVIQQKLFEKEPLAMALITHLSQKGILNSEDVIDTFNKMTNKKIKDLINETYEEEKGQETVF